MTVRRFVGRRNHLSEMRHLRERSICIAEMERCFQGIYDPQMHK